MGNNWVAFSQKLEDCTEEFTVVISIKLADVLLELQAVFMGRLMCESRFQ